MTTKKSITLELKARSTGDLELLAIKVEYELQRRYTP